ncbi:LysE family translocator [Saccharospirillum salsuginis]|uniref:Threonine efflux protein n=1 Tax=Saccharospirillum salsuginis TaxID=418750 RepID=A0A918K3X9_9GAMM|nr:LysE family translocator [Saccharospirillum salsuginis]GGX47722.1 threonine efflux protein [Saccharospirillum salsuginis]
MDSVFNLLLAFAAYVIATASPGPATLAIMDVAMSQGRKSALVFAGGVITGSMTWALAAVIGIASLLSTYVQLFYMIKLLGGVYLLWLAYKSLRSALAHGTSEVEPASRTKTPLSTLYLRGLGLHLTNPKALFAWMAIVALALPEGSSALSALLIVVGCLSLGVLVFGGYAVLFSTPRAQAAYRRLGAWFNGVLSAVFGAAGLRLLLSRN